MVISKEAINLSIKILKMFSLNRVHPQNLLLKKSTNNNLLEFTQVEH